MNAAAPDVEARMVAYLLLARRIAGHMARVRGLRGYDADALQAAALVGLWKAARGFREECGATFPMYARRRISGEVLDALRSESSLNYRRKFDREFGAVLSLEAITTRPRLEDDGSIGVPDARAADPSSPAGDAFEDAIPACASPRDRDVLRWYFRDGLTMRQVGDRLGVGESRICQVLGRIFRRARAEVAA